MNAADFIALLPLLLVAGTSIMAMLGIALSRHHGLTAAIALAGLAAAFASLWIAASEAPRSVTQLLTIDRYALFYMGLIFAASAAFTLLAYGYFEKCRVHREELYVLMLVATLGASVLVASSHLISLFLGLELLSIALYGMIAYVRTQPLSLEAGLKYLVLAAVSAAILLFGIALIYSTTGTMQLSRIAAMSGAPFDRRIFLAGLLLVLAGLGFKLAVVPFHLWTPDVYEGAPAPVTGYIATVSKGAVFATLLRYLAHGGLAANSTIYLVIAGIAMASMIAGNLLALKQSNVKRILAYSSIAHLGYFLVALEAGGAFGAMAASFYLTAYFVTILGTFGVISILSNGDDEPLTLEAYQGLFWRRPALAAVFTTMLLSLAGIPVTAGFIGKFYVVAAGASAARWALAFTLVITSGIGLYYYLRIIIALYGEPEGQTAPQFRVTAAPAFALGALMVLLIWFGIFPRGLLGVIRNAVAGVS